MDAIESKIGSQFEILETDNLDSATRIFGRTSLFSVLCPKLCVLLYKNFNATTTTSTDGRVHAVISQYRLVIQFETNFK